MTNDSSATKTAKPDWEKPDFRKLGTLRDIAGRGGAGFQSGPNTRAPNS